ncbi:diguanylate cyclase [Rhizobium sp. 18065]|uniref:GGDEF domain-containing protein n=1 Tax=Rhizobium sp. 18065 TaxID=2681411 RepID=UPI00135C60C9|nr:diguanylate cyclase [Rhizobium sp. 18065]
MEGVNQQGHAHSSGTAGDPLAKIASFMARHGIAGLPRNFELVHEAFSGLNPELARELAALGAQPSQLNLDQLGLKHRLAGHCGVQAERLHAEALTTLSRIKDQITLGLTQKRSFARSVETVAQAIQEDLNQGIEQLLNELDLLSSVASQMVQAETLLANDIAAGIDVLTQADRVARAAKGLALRDRLTGLPNRIAFLQQLDGVYAADGNGAALILIEVPDLADIQHQYGVEAATKLIKKLATIFRKTIKKHDYVARIEIGTFAFLFTDVSADDTHVIAERLHSAAENNLVFATENNNDAGGLALAIGHALSTDTQDGLQLLALAETAVQMARTNPRQPIIGHRPSGRQVA